MSQICKPNSPPFKAAACAIGLSLFAATPAMAQFFSYETAATHAIVIDYETGQTLLDKNADEAVPPASMSKLMTAAMVFDALDQGRLSLDDQFPVSENAFRKEGSTMFLNLTDEPTISELLRGVIVQSGNDACIVLAEGLAGSESVFAARMTRRGKEIGLEQSVFANATGLPDDGHRMSVRDLAKLARYIIQYHPQHYSIYAERQFVWAGVDQPNRNPLLYMDIGGDGLKTGFIEESGYSMVGSAEQDGRRVIAVIAGMKSQRARTLEIKRVISWAFREFERKVLAEAGDAVGTAEIWLGDVGETPLVLDTDLVVAAPVHSAGAPEAIIRYRGPIEAPIAAGQQVAELELRYEGLGPIRAPLTAPAAVERGGYFSKVSAGVSLLIDMALRPIMAGMASPDAATQ